MRGLMTAAHAGSRISVITRGWGSFMLAINLPTVFIVGERSANTGSPRSGPKPKWNFHIKMPGSPVCSNQNCSVREQGQVKCVSCLTGSAALRPLLYTQCRHKVRRWWLVALTGYVAKGVRRCIQAAGPMQIQGPGPAGDPLGPEHPPQVCGTGTRVPDFPRKTPACRCLRGPGRGSPGYSFFPLAYLVPRALFGVTVALLFHI